jgi:hypothetical protein
MRDTIDDGTLVRMAEQALTRPPDFAYYGGYPLFESWGFTPVAQHRDSDALDRSNYRRILQDMTALNNDLVEFVADFRSGDWAFGWREEIIVRVLYDADEDVTPDNITGAFRMITEISKYLSEHYPVYDEPDYSELESEETREAFDQAWESVKRGWDEDDSGPEPTEDEKDLTWQSLEIWSGDDVDEDKIREFLDEKRLEDAIAQYGDVPRTGTVIPGQMAFFPHPLEET